MLLFALGSFRRAGIFRLFFSLADVSNLISYCYREINERAFCVQVKYRKINNVL